MTLEEIASMMDRLDEIQKELELDLTAVVGEGNYKLYREFAIMRDAWEFTVFITVAGKKVRMDGTISSNDINSPHAVNIVTAGWWASIVYYLNEY